MHAQQRPSLAVCWRVRTSRLRSAVSRESPGQQEWHNRRRRRREGCPLCPHRVRYHPRRHRALFPGFSLRSPPLANPPGPRRCSCRRLRWARRRDGAHHTSLRAAPTRCRSAEAKLCGGSRPRLRVVHLGNLSPLGRQSEFFDELVGDRLESESWGAQQEQKQLRKDSGHSRSPFARNSSFKTGSIGFGRLT